MKTINNWKELPDGKEKRNLYYTSREWGKLRKQVKDRCGGVCEKCKQAKVYAVHHLTYERLYSEKLDDLAGLCEQCHDAEHGRSDEQLDVVYDMMAIVRKFFATELINGWGIPSLECLQDSYRWNESWCDLKQSRHDLVVAAYKYPGVRVWAVPAVFNELMEISGVYEPLVYDVWQACLDSMESALEEWARI